MGQVLQLRPIVRVERFGGLWGVSVRPCPKGVASLRGFASEAEAAEYARDLQARYGWHVRPCQYATDDLSGAA